MYTNYTMRHASWLLLLFLSFNLFGQSPQHDACGYVGKSPWLTAYQNGEIAIPRQQSDTMVVGLKLHVVGQSSGEGYVNMQRLMGAVEVLQKDFQPLGVYFYIEGDIRFIPNSSFYEHDFTTGALMMSLNNRPNVINCYIVEDSGNNGGYYLASQDALVVPKRLLTSTRNFTHELGHYFTLPHTFVGWEGYFGERTDVDTFPAPRTINNRLVELADGSNCAEAADGFCDTPADYLSFGNGWACNNLGFYPDSLLDPDSVRFAVPAENIMSYARSNCFPEPGEGGFSEEQKSAMTANLLFRNDLVRDSVTFELTAANGDDVVLIEPEDGANLFPVDELTVTLRWNQVPKADFYVVQLNGNPFFGANPQKEITVTDTTLVLTEADGLRENGRLFWRVMPINRFQPLSDFGDEVFDFRVRNIVSSTFDPTLGAGISIFPNPMSSSESAINVVATELPETSTVQLQIFDPTGRILATQEVNPVGRQLNYRWLLNQPLPSGIYSIRLQQGDRFTSQRIVVSQ